MSGDHATDGRRCQADVVCCSATVELFAKVIADIVASLEQQASKDWYW